MKMGWEHYQVADPPPPQTISFPEPFLLLGGRAREKAWERGCP